MLDEKKKAALEAYLSKKGDKPGEKGGEKPVVKEETEIEVEDEGGDVPDDFSYRMSEDRDPEDEYYGAMGRDPSEMDTTNRAPRGEDPRSRGSRIGKMNGGALRSAFEKAQQMRRGA